MRILNVLPTEPEHMEKFRAAMPEGDFVCMPREQAAAADVAEAEIILGNVDAKLLPCCRRLRWIQLSNAGTDGYCERLPEGAVLTNATGAYGLAISEHMLGMLLSLQKKLYLYRDNQHAHCWHDEGHVPSIDGSAALIVGAGDIGSDFGRKLHALGAVCDGIRRTGTTVPEGFRAIYGMDALDALLPKADIVALCLPGTPQTAGLMNARRLALMRKNAFLLNIGRGSAIDSMALNDALRAGHLGGAGMDVTDPEPLPAEHPLWDAPRCIITPHISGQFHLHQTFEKIIGITAENLAHFRAGEPLRNIVDLTTGYRRL